MTSLKHFSTWWRHGREILPILTALCDGVFSTGTFISPSKDKQHRTFAVVFAANLNMLWEKESSCRRCERPWWFHSSAIIKRRLNTDWNGWLITIWLTEAEPTVSDISCYQIPPGLIRSVSAWYYISKKYSYNWFSFVSYLSNQHFLLNSGHTFHHFLQVNWGQVTHKSVSKPTSIGSDNGLSPGWRQVIIWINVGILLIATLGTKVSEILSKIHTFSFKKMHFKMSSVKRRQICLGLNVLTWLTVEQ